MIVSPTVLLTVGGWASNRPGILLSVQPRSTDKQRLVGGTIVVRQ